MKVTSSRIHLLNVRTGELEPAELLDAITEQQLVDWESAWQPALSNALQELQRSGVDLKHWPQSRHWDWRRKTNAFQGLIGAPAFSVLCNEMTQGMMIANTVKNLCRLSSQKHMPQVYIEYIENAPWNRSGLMEEPQYRGVGTILMRAAIELSVESEFAGRIGLHALPQAEPFYENTCGMNNLGPDEDYEGLCYFEMTPQQASLFRKGGES